MARISFPGGALFVPAKTPYEREVLFEHLALYANRHGRVRLDLDRNEWTISLTASPAQLRCASCGEELDHLSFALGGRMLCGECARRTIR